MSAPANLNATGARLAADRPYPERAEDTPSRPDRLAQALADALRRSGQALRRPLPARAHPLRPIVALTDRHAADTRALGEAGLQDQALALRLALRRQGLQPALVGKCFALVREAAGRSLAKRH